MGGNSTISFYNQALTKDVTNSDAWLGKGIAIVYTSKIGDIKTTEAIAYWKNAIKHAPNSEAMCKRVAKEINDVVNSFYPSIERHYIEFSTLDNAYSELVSRFAKLEQAQEYATNLDSDNLSLYETGLALCQLVIKVPNQVVSSQQSSAMAESIMGAVTGNKYDRNSGIANYNKAEARKKEIAIAKEIVRKIAKKYVENINRLDPERNLKLSESKQSSGAWYDNITVVILLCVFFWPAGVYGLYMRSKNKK